MTHWLWDQPGTDPNVPSPSETAWGRGAGEGITAVRQKTQRGWSPSLQQEETARTDHWGSEDVPPLRPDQWQPVEALGPPGEEGQTRVPLEKELSERTREQLEVLARSAHLAQPRFGLDTPLDPLASSSTLKYVHEGELLKLRLLLDNLTLEGLSSLSVQEVSGWVSCVEGEACLSVFALCGVFAFLCVYFFFCRIFYCLPVYYFFLFVAYVHLLFFFVTCLSPCRIFVNYHLSVYFPGFLPVSICFPFFTSL